MTILTLFIVLLKGETLLVKRPLLWLGSFFFSCKSLLFYLAITYSELYADVYAINTLQVAFVAILGWLVLGERCDLVDLFLIALIMVGAVIVIQPKFILDVLHDTSQTANRCDKLPVWGNRTYQLDQYFNASNETLGTFDMLELHQIPDNSNLTTENGHKLPKYYVLGNVVNTPKSPMEALSNSSASSSANLSYGIQQFVSKISGKDRKEKVKCNRLLSGLLAVLSTACMSAFYVCLRTTKDLFLGTVVLYKNSVGVVITVIIASSLNMWTFPAQGIPWLILLALCISGGLSFGLSVIALRREKAAVVSIGRTSQVIFSYLMEISILQHLPNVASSVGASFTVFASLVFFLRRLYRDRGEEKENEHTPILNGAMPTDVKSEKYGMDNQTKVYQDSPPEEKPQ
jgi:drug/metabolite transporter (DMT)-like permease